MKINILKYFNILVFIICGTPSLQSVGKDTPLFVFLLSLRQHFNLLCFVNFFPFPGGACEHQQFQCSNGRCIRQSAVCNGICDCAESCDDERRDDCHRNYHSVNGQSSYDFVTSPVSPTQLDVKAWYTLGRTQVYEKQRQYFFPGHLTRLYSCLGWRSYRSPLRCFSSSSFSNQHRIAKLVSFTKILLRIE